MVTISDYAVIVNMICLKLCTVKPLITNTSKEFIKCRILHFLIMECCMDIYFLIK